MGEQAVHLSKARLAGSTLSNLDRKPRICGIGKKKTRKKTIKSINLKNTPHVYNTFVEKGSVRHLAKKYRLKSLHAHILKLKENVMLVY